MSASLRESEIVSGARIVVPPMTHRNETGIACKCEELFSRRVKRNPRPIMNHRRLAHNFPVHHPSCHTEARAQVVFAVKICQRPPVGVKSWFGRRTRNKRNLANEDARSRLRDAVYLAQTDWNFLPRDDQQHTVADDDRRTRVWQREAVGEGLSHIEPRRLC